MSRIIEFRKSAQKAAKQSVQDKTCAFTGHRPQSLPFGFDESDKRCASLKSVMRDQIAALIENEGVMHSAAHSGRWCGGPAAAVRFKKRPKLVSYIRFNHHGVVLCCTL